MMKHTKWIGLVGEVKINLVGCDYLTKVLAKDEIYGFNDYIPLCEAVIAEKLGLTKNGHSRS